MFGLKKSLTTGVTLLNRNGVTAVACFASRAGTYDQPHYRAMKRRSSSRSRQAYTLSKLKHFIDSESAPGESLAQNASRYAKKDRKFSQFMENFDSNQEKSIKFGNILDFRSNNIPNVFAKNDEQRKKELITLDQYIRRDQQRSFRGKIEDLKKALSGGEDSSNVNALDNDYMNPVHQEINSQILGHRGEFTCILLDSDITTNITRLYRPKKARVLLFGGNCDGVIGWGMGTGKNHQVAMENAKRALLRNLIAINLEHEMECPVPLNGKFNGISMQIVPDPTFNNWGNPLVGWFLRLAGMDNCRFRVVGQNSNRYTLVKAFFATITQNQTPMSLAESGAVRRQRLIYGTELRNSKDKAKVKKSTDGWWEKEMLQTLLPRPSPSFDQEKTLLSEIQ